MKTFGKTLMIAATAATVAVATPVLAAGMGGGMDGRMPGFLAADTDKDGAISRAEADALHAERFSTADADGDGTITRDEMRAMRAAMHGDRMGGRHGMMMDGKHHRAQGGMMLQRVLEVMDTDGSGAVNQEELLAHFKTLDSNGDGAVTVQEMRDGMRAEMQKQRQGAGPRTQ
jgi:Ca2+-binding EF-hand superfamily protein